LKPSKKDQMLADAVELIVWFQSLTHQMTGLSSGQPP
jgi:hypothetical protein